MVGSLLGAALLFTMGSASAWGLTITTLKGQNLDGSFGQYAPGGDCTRTPRLTVDASGFTFTLPSGQTVHPPRFEWALTYMGDRYEGKSTWFFPFPRNDDDLGPLLLTLNAAETPGRIAIENNLGKPLPEPYAALVRGSPYARCGRAPVAAAERPPPPRGPAIAARPTQSLEWSNLAQAADANGHYDMFDRGGISSVLKNLLGAKVAALENNLSVSTPLSRAGNIYYMSGNAERRGGYDMAYVLLDPAQRAAEVGLWEGGKLTLYRTLGRRITLPADIVRMRAEQPPEEAVAAPGPPWEYRPLAGGQSLALGTPAASTHIDTISLYCDRGRGYFGMMLYRAPAVQSLTLSLVFNGGIVNLPMRSVDVARKMWVSDLAPASPVLRMLTTQKDVAYLRINQASEGEVTVAGASQAGRRALSGCIRF